MNKWIGVGRLTKDAEVRYNGDKALARVTVAIDRRFSKEGEQSADFISCVAFGKTAEFLEKYGTRGTKFVVEGRIQTGSYEKDGQRIYTTDIVIENVEFAESKKTDAPAKDPKTSNDDFMNQFSDVEMEQLPFN